jgi:hypothetical protein
MRCRAPASRRFRVHHFSGVDPFREEANPPIDLAQPPFAVLIVGVFTAVAVARGPRDHLSHRRPFLTEQEPVLVLEPLQAARGDVVLDLGPACLCVVRLSRKRFGHVARS